MKPLINFEETARKTLMLFLLENYSTKLKIRPRKISQHFNPCIESRFAIDGAARIKMHRIVNCDYVLSVPLYLKERYFLGNLGRNGWACSFNISL